MSQEPVLGNRNDKTKAALALVVVAPLFFGLVIGAVSLGSGLSRALRAGSVCRDANGLAALGVNMADPQSQTLILRSAAGLGLSLPGTASIPNPNGKGALILTRVIKVGRKTCARGIANWNGDPAACPNYQKFVIASRIVIGNKQRWQSGAGTPISERGVSGGLTDADIVSIAGNRASDLKGAQGKPAFAALKDDESVSVAEMFTDVSDLRVPYLIDVDSVQIRDIS